MGRVSGGRRPVRHRSPRGFRSPGALGDLGVLGVLGVLGAFLIVGCDGPGSPPPFPDSAADMDTLGRSVIEALVRADTAALRRFRLTEREHNEVIWPELPAAAAEVGFPVDLAWSNIEARSRRDLGRILTAYRGRRLAFEQVDCLGETRTFATFRVHTDCWVVFETGDPDCRRARIFKDVVERYGGFKIFRYYDGGPRPHAGD